MTQEVPSVPVVRTLLVAGMIFHQRRFVLENYLDIRFKTCFAIVFIAWILVCVMFSLGWDA